MCAGMPGRTAALVRDNLVLIEFRMLIVIANVEIEG